MKHLKRWLALMVAAALALSLLTGCCTVGGTSSNLLLEVLMGQVENVSVETDPAFDRALKAAVQRGGSDPDAVFNALVEELEITAPLRFSISGLGSGSAGQQGLDVVFQSGTNPNAAANNAATAWLPILRGLEGNGGAYSARASLVEVNGGYILAIGVKVEQPGEEDEPDPVTLKSIAVNTPPAKTEYWVNETFDPTGMEITATYSNNTTTTINGITETDKKDVSWTPETLDTAGKQTVTISYGGKSTTVSVTVKEPEVKELKVEYTSLTYTAGATFRPANLGTITATYTYGSDKEINISECDLTLTLPNGSTASADNPYTFDTAGNYTLTVSYKGGTATVFITVTANTNGYYQDKDGNYVVTDDYGLQQLFTEIEDIGDFTGTITLTCDQTVNGRLTDTFQGTLQGKEGSKPTITLTGNEGLFGTLEGGEVAHLDVTVTGTINTSTEYTSNAYATGAVADVNNGGSITGCTVTVNGSITATRTGTGDAPTSACAGGIVGCNSFGTIENCDVTISGSITAAVSSTNAWSSTDANAGGIAGYNDGTIESSCSVELNGGSIQATATGTDNTRTFANACGIAGYDFGNGVKCGPATGTGTIKATVTGTSSSSDGSVTLTLNSNTVTVAPSTIQPDSYGIYTDGYAYAGTKTVQPSNG